VLENIRSLAQGRRKDLRLPLPAIDELWNGSAFFPLTNQAETAFADGCATGYRIM